MDCSSSLEQCINITNGALKKYFIYLILERVEGREKAIDRNINVWLSLTSPVLGTWLTTQVCALTGN